MRGEEVVLTRAVGREGPGRAGGLRMAFTRGRGTSWGRWQDVRPLREGRGDPPRGHPLGSCGYLTRHPVGAELPEAQRGLDPPQQGHHVQVFDSAPAGGHAGSGTRRAGGWTRVPACPLSGEEAALGFPGARRREWALSPGWGAGTWGSWAQHSPPGPWALGPCPQKQGFRPEGDGGPLDPRPAPRRPWASSVTMPPGTVLGPAVAAFRGRAEGVVPADAPGPGESRTESDPAWGAAFSSARSHGAQAARGASTQPPRKVGGLCPAWGLGDPLRS